MDYPEIYAVDFDKTLNLADTYPELGEPNMELIEFLKERRRSSLRVQMGSSPRADRFDSCRRMAQNPELKGERR